MRYYQMLEQFLHDFDHPVQTIGKGLIGDQPGEPIKQVLFSEGVDFLELRVTLFTTDKQEKR